MGQNMLQLPKDLECSDGRFCLDIRDHEIIDMMVYYENIYDGGNCHLFNFVAACIINELDWVFGDFEEQGLTVEILADICAGEILGDAYALYDVVEHDRTTYDEDSSISQDGIIKKSIYKKQVDSGIISKKAFIKIWHHTTERPNTFESL